MQETMKAMVYRAYGPPRVLHLGHCQVNLAD